MQFSAVGLVIYVLLCLPAAWGRHFILTGLIASFSFGATAILTLDSLGGASPVVYTFVALTLIGLLVLRLDTVRRAGLFFAREPMAWLFVALVVQVVVGAYLLPRLFADQTTVSIVTRTSSGSLDVPLGPGVGNVTQTAYFVLNAVTALFCGILLLETRALDAVRIGLFAAAILNAGFGVIDFAGKLVGLGDVLEPIRTASYAMLTGDDMAGFQRIAGAYSEASTFGSAVMGSLAFVLTYWRNQGGSGNLALAALLLTLLLLSTSTTAYLSAAVFALLLALSMLRRAMRGHVPLTDLGLVVSVLAIVTLLLALYLRDGNIFDPVEQLMRSAIFNKGQSASGIERSAWNMRSLATIRDTGGLGIGFGSARTSSWLIAFVSQVGLIGSVMMGVIVAALFVSTPRVALPEAARIVALHDAVCAFALAGLFAMAISSGGADPGMPFFLSVVVVLACRTHLRLMAAEGRGPAYGSAVAGLA